MDGVESSEGVEGGRIGVGNGEVVVVSQSACASGSRTTPSRPCGAPK